MSLPDETLVSSLRQAYEGSSSAEIRGKVSTLVETARSARGFNENQLRRLLDGWHASFSQRREALPTLDDALDDLSRWLSPRPRGGRLRDHATWVLDHATPIFTLLTLFASTFLGLAYIRFYAALGASLEDVGIGPTQILTRSVLGTLAVVTVASLAIFLYFVPFIPLTSARDASQTAGATATASGGQIIGFLSLLTLQIAVVSVAIFVSGSYLFYGLPRFFLLAQVIFPVLFTLAFAIKRITLPGRGRKFGVQFRAMRFHPTDFAQALAIFVPFIFIASIIFIQLYVSNQISVATDGKAVRQSSFLGMPVLGLQAQPVQVNWKGEPPEGLEVSECVLFLGGSNGFLTLYDVERRAAFRLTDADVVIARRRERSSCFAPVNRSRPKVEVLKKGLYRCMRGKWASPEKVKFSYEWIVNRFRLATDRGNEYRPPTWLRGSTLRCRVKARNVHGDDVAYSEVFVIPAE